jgi:CRISPR/Cas system CMR-associated protein Cmr5 small subunit
VSQTFLKIKGGIKLKSNNQLEKELSKIKEQTSSYTRKIVRVIQKNDKTINLTAIIALLQVSKTVLAYLEDDKFRYKNKNNISTYLEATDNIIKGIIESAKQNNNLN